MGEDLQPQLDELFERLDALELGQPSLVARVEELEWEVKQTVVLRRKATLRFFLGDTHRGGQIYTASQELDGLFLDYFIERKRRHHDGLPEEVEEEVRDGQAEETASVPQPPEESSDSE